jgi:hypothetical protein
VSDPNLLKSEKGVACFAEKGKWGFRKDGTVLIPPAYDDADGIFINGMMRVMKDSLYGYVNENGVEIVKPAYKRVETFDKHRLAVVTDATDKEGLIDKTGKFIIPCCYKYIFVKEKFVDASTGKEDNDEILFDFNGKVLVADFSYLNDINGNVIAGNYETNSDFYITNVKKGDSWLHGILDADGNEICKPVFEDVKPFCDGIAVVKRDGKKCFINTKGKILFE